MMYELITNGKIKSQILIIEFMLVLQVLVVSIILSHILVSCLVIM